MAKADPRRDYYADLELSPGADVNEINKQYRKLALKFHPDRNPGKEAEYNAKFQDIKSAQEILTDPVQRAKYDAERARLGHAYGYAPPRPAVPGRNPYTATSNYPPPPSRTQPRPAYASTASTGASRYSNFPKPAANGAAPEDVHARANAFRAFENMNKASHQPSSRPASAAYRTPPKPPYREPPPAAAASARAARSGWESFGNEGAGPPPGVHRAQSTRTSKKAGFAPATPGGDEPAAPGASYFNAARASSAARPAAPRAQTTRFPPGQTVPPPTPQRAPKPDTLGQFKAQNADALDPHSPQSPRVRTPYSTKGGEKTYFSSGALGRSASTREPPPRKSSGRHRSASPPRSRPYDQHPKPGYSTRPGSPEKSPRQRTMSDAGLSPQQQQQHASGRPHSQQAPSRSRRNSSSSDDHTAHVDRPTRDGRDRGRRKAQPRVYPAYERGFQQPSAEDEGAPASVHHSYRVHRHSPPEPSGPSNLFPDGQPRARSRQEEHGRSSPTYDTSGLTSRFSTCHIQSPSTQAQPSGQAVPQPQSHPDAAPPPRAPGLWFEWRPEKRKADGSPPSSFTFAVDDETFARTRPVSHESKSRSAESINTRFSPASWDGQFTSNGADYFQAPPTTENRARARGRVSPVKSGPDRRAREAYGSQEHGANGVNGMNGAPTAPPAPPPKEPIPPAAPVQTQFVPEYWAEKFKQHSWEPPPPASPSRSASLHPKRSEPRLKGSRPQGLSKGTSKRPTVPRPAAVSTSDDDDSPLEMAHKGRPNRPGRSKASRASSGSSSSAMDIDASTPPGHPVAGTAARPIERPADDGQTPRAETTSGPSHLRPAVPPRPRAASERRPPSGEGLRVDLHGLKEVEPLASTARRGLDGLDELSSTLPFESRAAGTLGGRGLEPRPLMLPRVPKAPPPPATVTQAGWEEYLAASKAYMVEWTAFNERMLGHFNDRQREARGGLTAGWMGAVGEGERGGFGRYMQGVEEDFRVREHWDVAWERHREAMRAFGKTREAVLRGARA
ncbi:MAG: hypothetical protein M1832_000880 [Thelocarpon impressellum]|nr:MAG: hypothetical protein M1832_000880 [Thelocarpon impressellum]